MMEKLLLHPYSWLPSSVSGSLSYVFPLYLNEEPTSSLPIPLLREMRKSQLERYFATFV